MTTASNPAISVIDTHTYSHPIPNRDFILNLIKKCGKALNREQIAAQLKLFDDAELEGLRRRLRAMERDGQVTYDRRYGYSVQKNDDLISGRVIGHRDGFGFLARDGAGDDLLLSERDMLTLFDGDRVQVRCTGVDRRGREKACLVAVIERHTTKVVGQLKRDQDDYYIVPENRRIPHEIDLDNKQLMGAKDGQYVVATITDYPCQRYRAFGKVTEVLGNELDPGLEIEVAIREHDIPYLWPLEVSAAANELNSEVLEADKLQRLDLRKRPFVTIDGEDAKDFDDAVYCEPRGDGWCLWVAIADVSHYVTPDSLFDREAEKRGTSVYFPGKVVPMLPEALSNGLCSLNPNVDRLVMVCEMLINKKGKMTGYQFFEGVIHSHARLTYGQVNAMLTAPGSKLGKRMTREHNALVPHLNSLHKLYGVLKQARTARGAIDFDTQEVQFKFNAARKIEQILPLERNDAHKLIEECMLCANVATARFLAKLKLPAMYRNHSGPNPVKLKNLRAFLKVKGLKLSGGDKPTPVDYQQLFRRIEKRSDVDAIQSMMLRSLSQAEYSPNNAGHFGLAYSGYAHFTSPIRRYPDLLVHRAIRSAIRGKQTTGLLQRMLKPIRAASRQKACTNYPYSFEKIDSFAKHCSYVSVRADKASRDVEAWLKCNYMLEAVGDTFKGVITTVTQFGLFVELEQTKIEGLVHINSLGNDFYKFDGAQQALIGSRQSLVYAVGDTIEISVAKVDMEQRKIEFNLASLKTKKNKLRTKKQK